MTERMLREMAGERVSAFLRTLIAVEYGRRAERKSNEGGYCELVQPS